MTENPNLPNREDKVREVNGVDYRCGQCGAHGVKLWRDTGFGLPLDLFCVTCAIATGRASEYRRKYTPESPADVDAQGYSIDKWGTATDQMASLVPAVPVDGTFWGYTSVPERQVRWWRSLPNFPTPAGALR